ncbi:MAG: hydantoinase/oxoprolinase family protein [Smithellaceae bacterium]|nr:hydantoinase/oxoprolinase family protein [Smithellaceae bacterium]
MILGIDVGGTHTDAVLLEDLRVKRKAKVATNPKDLLTSLLDVTTEILKDDDPKRLKRVVLSTTISTNAIVQNKIDRVGMIVAAGPGISHETLEIDGDTHFVSGYVNHRGIEAARIAPQEISPLIDQFKAQGIKHVGVVGKFSTRNASQETALGELLSDQFRYVSLGHRMSGHLNFKRRIATTYLNTAVWELYNNFTREVLDFVAARGIEVPIYILKADGGTFEIKHSREFPVQTILAGPAASIMGVLCTSGCREDAVALDIGGTTTDIAVFADGIPLLEAFGVTIEGHKTLIRGLHTKSIGIGGDSRVKVQDGRLVIGPEREGPAAAFGGPAPTPTDAMIVLGLTDIGDASKAKAAMDQIATQMNITAQEAAHEIFEETCRKIVVAVHEVIEEINNKPVYTIHEILAGKKLTPEALYIVGGPARPMRTRLGELLNLDARIHEHAEVANAIGAALARTTAEVTIVADTELKTLTMGEDGLQISINPGFTRDQAITIGKEKLREKALRLGAKEEDLEIEVIEDQEFNMVRDGCRTGKNLRIKLQVKPGLISGFTLGEKIC